MTAVKICGVIDRETALVALEAGADMLGFVLAPSRRQLSPEAAAAIILEARRSFPPQERPWLAVGVFANQPLGFVRAAAAVASLDVVQLSGEESPEFCRQLDTPVYKALHLGTEGGVGRGLVLRRQENVTTKTPGPQDSNGSLVSSCLGGYVPDIVGFRQRHGAERVLLDSGGAGTWGGTGLPFQWHQVGDAARDCLVAGGLSSRNVAEAIGLLRPWGVDASSGVERDGRKDPELIRAFISEAKGGNSRERER